MPDDLLESLSFALGSPPAAAQPSAAANVTSVDAAESEASDETVASGDLTQAEEGADEAAESDIVGEAAEQAAERRERRDRSERRKTVDRRSGEVAGGDGGTADYSGPERGAAARRVYIWKDNTSQQQTN